VQGRVVGVAQGTGRDTIIEHPDVRRMLMTMRAFTEAMRCTAYVTAAALDKSKHHPDPVAKGVHQEFAEFMIPIVKGWCTETAQKVANLGLQAHGGMGFIEETGAAQHVRDARITTIYEGTTSIQANDFIGRKTARDGGRVAQTVIAEMSETAKALVQSADANLVSIGRSLGLAIGQLKVSLGWLLSAYSKTPREAFATSVPYLQMWGLVCGGWQLGRAALIAAHKMSSVASDREYLQAKIATARFYADALLPEATSLGAEVIGAGPSTLALATEQF